MIDGFQNMRLRLTEPERWDIADEHEEYWRLRFYTLLQENRRKFTIEYFLPRGGLYNPDSIGHQSVAVIFDFVKWREGMPDPLESVNDKELFASGAVPLNFPGVIDYPEKYEEYWADVMRLSEPETGVS
jgi:hypothetical protein